MADTRDRKTSPRDLEAWIKEQSRLDVVRLHNCWIAIVRSHRLLDKPVHGGTMGGEIPARRSAGSATDAN